ncbi:MAG: ferredoxin [bacterium]|nr:ferredoxin [bacterium]
MPNESIGTKEEGKIRKIVVDRDACIGARSCAIAAANTFEIDDENLALVKRDPSQFDDDDTIVRGAEACPVLCIHLYGENDEKIFPN